MTTKLYLLLVLLALSCKPKTISEVQSSSKVDTINNAVVEIKEEEEVFSQFFQKFKNDSLFQKQRIDNPISVIIYEEDVEEVTKHQVNYVSFDSKDWDMEINVKTEGISQDTMNVILEGTDTGVRIEHIFVNRNLRWYLFQIINYSD